MHLIGTLVDGRSIFFEKYSPEERLYVQYRFEGRLFCVSPSFKLPEIYQVQMERKSLSVSMPLLWPKFSSQDINKTNDNPNFAQAETECETDDISKRYFDNESTRKELIQVRQKTNLCYIHARFYSF